MTMRAMARGEQPPADDEFLQQLYRGGELLAAGKVIEAKDFLERAHKLQPNNAKGQNLLGLTYFKLGLFERAAELYERLVRDNPVDPTLRVNLGLVYLKTSALQRAVREFEVATDLAPEHQKAHNYLGLALAQLGEYGRAREHFLRAGSEAMAERMSRAIAGEGFSRPAPEQPATARGFAEIEGTDVVREQGGEPVGNGLAEASSPPPSEEDWAAQFGFDEEAPRRSAPALEPRHSGAFPAIKPSSEATPARRPGAITLTLGAVMPASEAAAIQEQEASASKVTAKPVLEVPSVPWEEAPAAESPPEKYRGRAMRHDALVPVLRELAPSVALAGASPMSPFVVGKGSFSVRVDGGLHTRLEGLVAFSGKLAFHPESKHFRGRATEQPFGEGAGRMVRASGTGVLFLEPAEGRSFLAVELGGESAYLRDAYVFAFEEPLTFENGRVSSEGAPDLELVHLRGQGKVVLSLPGTLRAVAVAEAQPVTVPLTHLVGWQGNLSARRVAVLKGSGGEVLQSAVELSGEGFALISLPVR